MFDFEYQIKMLPEKPGVYIMKNSTGTVIYVGKAKILKNRVRQYFQKSKNHSEKVKNMVHNIAEFEYVVTDSEVEALILECNLIKKYRPKYNILMKDDKSYPFIKVTLNEDFPRVFMTRNIINDGSRYFGPYPEYSVVHEILLLIKQIFPLRTCKRAIKDLDTAAYNKSKPCLNYHIGLCKAPCCSLISKQQYSSIVNEVIELLLGKDKNIKKYLETQMDFASENLEFEKAAELRDKIRAVDKVSQKQKMYFGNLKNEDYIDIYSNDTDSCVQIFFIRDGKIIGREHFIYNDTSNYNEDEILSNFMKQFYGGTAFIPQDIVISKLNDKELIEEWLSIKKNQKVKIIIPQKGEKKKLLKMIQQNAKITLERFKSKYMMDKKMHQETLINLAEMLKLSDIPHRIEAYDISNIQGVDSVGSMVVFEDGRPKNSDYRRFKIKTVKTPNDYGSMKEILKRRFTHGFNEIKKIKENKLQFSSGGFSRFPDLLLIDGGLGQVNSVLEVLDELNIDIPVCGMVKDDHHRTRGLIYNNNEIKISSDKNIMKFITRIQDEVHRFAITYHRSLRDKRLLHSILDEIPNIGPSRKKQLLKKFGSIDKIKKADLEQLAQTPSMSTKAAESIKNYFK